MDFTPYLESLSNGNLDEVLLSVAVQGKVALALKGRFFLRCLCESFSQPTRIGCAVTDEVSCLNYLKQDTYELLICTDFLETGNGFELARKARQLQPQLKVVVLEAAVMAVMGHHFYRSPSLRSGQLPYLSCPRLTPREYEVLDLLASGLTDREIAEQLVVSEETARTYTKRLLKTLEVNNRVQAVLKGMRCGMVQI